MPDFWPDRKGAGATRSFCPVEKSVSRLAVQKQAEANGLATRRPFGCRAVGHGDGLDRHRLNNRLVSIRQSIDDVHMTLAIRDRAGLRGRLLFVGRAIIYDAARVRAVK